MATATAAAGAAPVLAPRGMALTRNHVLRYVAALCGLVVVIAFYFPWVRANLTAIGEVPLAGVDLARGDASDKVDIAVFGKSGAGNTFGSSSTSGASGATGAATAASAAGAANAASAAGLGGLVLPTRQPTAAAGALGASQIQGALQSGSAGSPTAVVATATPLSNASLPGGAPAVAAASTPEPPKPDTLPQVSLYLVPLMGLGIFGFSLIWHRLTDARDRRNGKAWTLILSLGGSLWIGSLLYKILTAPAANSLIGSGVGGVKAAEPALWVTFFGFLLAAVCLVLAWLSPTPPPPDPYWRARGAPAPAAAS